MEISGMCCQHCGKEITGKRRGTRFCSDSCRAMHSAKRRQDDLERLARVANRKIDELIASGREAEAYLADIQRKIETAMNPEGLSTSQ